MELKYTTEKREKETVRMSWRRRGLSLFRLGVIIAAMIFTFTAWADLAYPGRNYVEAGDLYHFYLFSRGLYIGLGTICVLVSSLVLFRVCSALRNRKGLRKVIVSLLLLPMAFICFMAVAARCPLVFLDVAWIRDKYDQYCLQRYRDVGKFAKRHGYEGVIDSISVPSPRPNAPCEVIECYDRTCLDVYRNCGCHCEPFYLFYRMPKPRTTAPAEVKDAYRELQRRWEGSEEGWKEATSINENSIKNLGE